MSLSHLISRWTSNEQQEDVPDSAPSASQAQSHRVDRRKNHSLRRLYNWLGTAAQARLRTDTKARAEDVTAA